MRSNSLNLPPSPFRLPIIGHLHLISKIPHQSLHKLSIKHGPLIHIKLGSVSAIVVSSADMAKECLKTNETCFMNRPKISVIEYLTYGSADFAFGHYGPYWKFMNKLCMSELLGGRTLERHYPVRREERIKLVKMLIGKASVGESVDIGRELVKMTSNIITRMMMGHRCSDYVDEDVGKLAKEVLELSGEFNLADFIWFCKNLDLQRFDKRLKDVKVRFDTMMDKIIERHQEVRNLRKMDGNGLVDSSKDILHMLLDIKDDPKSEVKLTMEHIKAFVLDIFAGGTDTSAITTEWAIAELINHPNIMSKARQEINTTVGKNTLVEESDIPKLPYIEAIIKETLRLHPTGPLIIRESNKKCTVRGFNIPEKTRIFINTWSIGRDEKYWEDALEFKPERFLNGVKKVDVRGQCFELLPFGSGRRMCPGISLAMKVVQTAVADLVQCFDWDVVGNGGKVSMDEGFGLTLPRAQPLICVPVVRLDPFLLS